MLKLAMEYVQAVGHVARIEMAVRLNQASRSDLEAAKRREEELKLAYARASRKPANFDKTRKEAR